MQLDGVGCEVSQSLPVQPFSQAQAPVAWSHVPWPEHSPSLPGQGRESHPLPVQGGVQVHVPFSTLQVPWPLQSPPPGHAFFVQFVPDHGSSQTHLPLVKSHVPCPEQVSSAQWSFSHKSPK